MSDAKETVNCSFFGHHAYFRKDFQIRLAINGGQIVLCTRSHILKQNHLIKKSGKNRKKINTDTEFVKSPACAVFVRDPISHDRLSLSSKLSVT